MDFKINDLTTPSGIAFFTSTDNGKTWVRRCGAIVVNGDEYITEAALTARPGEIMKIDDDNVDGSVTPGQ